MWSVRWALPLRTSKGTGIPVVPTPTSTGWAAGHFHLGLALQPYHTQHVHKHTGILGTPNHLHHWMAVRWGCVSLFLMFRATLFDCEDCFSADVWLCHPETGQCWWQRDSQARRRVVFTRGEHSLMRGGRMKYKVSEMWSSIWTKTRWGLIPSASPRYSSFCSGQRPIAWSSPMSHAFQLLFFSSLAPLTWITGTASLWAPWLQPLLFQTDGGLMVQKEYWACWNQEGIVPSLTHVHFPAMRLNLFESHRTHL